MSRSATLAASHHHNHSAGSYSPLNQYQSGKKPPSEAWEFFTKLAPRSPSQLAPDATTGEIVPLDGDWVQCKLCGLEMCQGEKSTTRGMWKHLVVAHKQVYKTTKQYSRSKGSGGVASMVVTAVKNEASVPPLRIPNTTRPTLVHQSSQKSGSQSSAAVDESLIDPEELNLDDEGNEIAGGQNHHGPATDSNGLEEEDGSVEQESGAMDEAVAVTAVASSATTNGGGGKGGEGQFSLAKLIQKQTALYDPAHPYYKHNEARAKIWDLVSAECGQPAEHIRIKWKTMRDRFKKELRRQAINAAANRPTQSMWPPFDEMTFLLPYMKDRQNDSSTGHLDYGGGAGCVDDFGNVAGGSNGECLMDGGMDLHSSNATNYILELAMNSISKSRGVVDDGAGDGGDSDPCDEPMIKRWQNGNSNHHSSHRGSAAGLKRPFGHGAGGYSNGSGGHHHLQNHDEDDSSEDELFCRIMMKKLRRMNDETKERAKAKIMDLLCKIQYGE